ncbi:TIGR03862 family flavoprotein [Luteolibacter yonseiensis]|uniref:TIGR03862 family flavoprotein n=1 Tax=Luteolibacter yonseiensis TaxID=1144680 RepID=A0A934V6U9_9BACT|nr:TIGR03862 family flavoprotein [Luteolibacter yonseiensis]MBK1815437.1 TIGR03862 family flavoprotein [Luteolibacter yonseiensis]
MHTHSQLAVIGGGPAGLRAAEVAATAGLKVTLYDAKPSCGRKFLVAGKGGLNLTHGESFDRFITRYTGPDQPEEIWGKLISGFDPAALRAWAAELGVETFQATSGRVYPKALKAAPLLRRWIERLRGLGVRLEMNHRLVSIDASPRLGFSNGHTATADAVILALGGGSWTKTGSDGGWVRIFEELGISHHPLAPANCGWEHEWPEEVLAAAEGRPLKNIHVRAGAQTAIGELMVTRYGLEGGAIYQLGTILRSMDEPAVSIDFKPTFTEEQLVAKMESVRRDFLKEAAIRWKLSEPAVAILGEKSHPDAASLAGEVKNCRVPLTRPRPIDEAISSAGGVLWSEIDGSLMLKKLPGVFLAGEMIDWEAPTGGYLMQGCFATATHAAAAAVEWLSR